MEPRPLIAGTTDGRLRLGVLRVIGVNQRTSFRVLLAIVVYHYVIGAIERVPGGFLDWFDLATAVVLAPTVLLAGWRYSE